MDLTPDYIALLDRYPAQVSELGGQIVTGFALQPSTTATAVRGDTVTDGPFIEAKETVAGFFILDAPDLDVAPRIVRLNPATRDGGVEVRPAGGCVVTGGRRGASSRSGPRLPGPGLWFVARVDETPARHPSPGLIHNALAGHHDVAPQDPFDATAAAGAVLRCPAGVTGVDHLDHATRTGSGGRGRSSFVGP